MTTTTTRTALQAGDKVLDTVAKAQGTVVSTVATVSSLIGGYLPPVSRIEIPSQIPTSREVIEQSYAFATKVLKRQKTYALDLVEAFEPLWGHFLKHDAPATRKAAKQAA